MLFHWEGGSGGPIATAAITHVADRLGLPYKLTSGEQVSSDFIHSRPGMDRATRTLGDTIYAGTQQWLRDRGIKTLTVMRSSRGGERWDAARPFTSWSLDWGGMRHESGREDVTAEVPAERVFSLPPTGPGTLAESEIVLLPSKTPGRVPASRGHAEYVNRTRAICRAAGLMLDGRLNGCRSGAF